MVTTNDDELADRLRRFRSHGIVRRPERGGWYYEISEVGFNYRLTDVQAALGSVTTGQARPLHRTPQRDCRTVSRGARRLCRSSCRRRPRTVSCTAITSSRCSCRIAAQTYDRLREAGIATQVHYVPVHHHPVSADIGMKPGDLPVCDRVYEGLLSLPMFPRPDRRRRRDGRGGSCVPASRADVDPLVVVRADASASDRPRPRDAVAHARSSTRRTGLSGAVRSVLGFRLRRDRICPTSVQVTDRSVAEVTRPTPCLSLAERPNFVVVDGYHFSAGFFEALENSQHAVRSDRRQLRDRRPITRARAQSESSRDRGAVQRHGGSNRSCCSGLSTHSIRPEIVAAAKQNLTRSRAPSSSRWAEAIHEGSRYRSSSASLEPAFESWWRSAPHTRHAFGDLGPADVLGGRACHRARAIT